MNITFVYWRALSVIRQYWGNFSKQEQRRAANIGCLVTGKWGIDQVGCSGNSKTECRGYCVFTPRGPVFPCSFTIHPFHDKHTHVHNTEAYVHVLSFPRVSSFLPDINQLHRHRKLYLKVPGWRFKAVDKNNPGRKEDGKRHVKRMWNEDGGGGGEKEREKERDGTKEWEFSHVDGIGSKVDKMYWSVNNIGCRANTSLRPAKGRNCYTYCYTVLP